MSQYGLAGTTKLRIVELTVRSPVLGLGQSPCQSYRAFFVGYQQGSEQFCSRIEDLNICELEVGPIVVVDD